MAAPKKLDAKALKERKQKRLAAILLVVMLAVCAFSVPKTLKMMNQQSAAATPPPAATTPAPDPAASAAAPVDAGAAAVAAAGAPTLAVSSEAPASVAGLVSFERLASKDPFVQQVGGVDKAAAPAPGATPGDAAAGAPNAEATPGATPSPGEVAAPGTTPGAVPGAVPGSTPASPAQPQEDGEVEVAQPASASISVNGAPAETVAVNGTFPAADPVFQLVELLPTGAKIAIYGGGYESGAKTITLSVGRPVTLMNTADGTRYEIVLVALG